MRGRAAGTEEGWGRRPRGDENPQVASRRVGAFRNASVPGCDNCVSVIDARIDLYPIVAAMKYRSVKDRAEGEGEMIPLCSGPAPAAVTRL